MKSTLNIHPIYEAKLLNYMNLIKSPKGILINFNCNNIFKEGQKTFVNDYYKKLPKE
nr:MULTISPECIES: GxxExxY protein [Flavobacterium]